MKIIQREPNPSGAYPGIQEGSFSSVPDGMVEWSAALDTATFYEYNGFVTLTIEKGVVVDYAANTEAWQEWKDAQPDPEPDPEPEPDPQDDTDAMLVDLDYRVTLLELELTEE
jgi:hypothetical protein